MANAQLSSSNSTSGTTSNQASVKQMGICQIGSKGPCNGSSVQ
jgi:hypothetical protein